MNTRPAIEPDNEEGSLKNAKLVFWIGTILGYIIILLLSSYLSTKSTTALGLEWNWGLALLLALILYTINSFKEIGPSDIGVRLLFGDAIDQVGSGLTLVPYGIFTLQKFPNEDQQAELPAEADDIYEGSESDPDGKNIPEGKVPPIRIVFGSPDNPNTTDPYDQRMVAKVTPVIRYRIVNAVKFIKTIKSWDNARLQIEDAVVAVLHEELSKITPAKALTMLSGPTGLYKKLEDVIDLLLESWGVDLINISLKPFGYSHKLNEAVLEVPKAQRTAVATIITARGEMRKRALEGVGAGSAVKSLITGKTKGLTDMQTKLNVTGSEALAAETALGITNGDNKVIIAGADGFANLATVGTVLGEALKPVKPKSTILLPQEAKK
ncbi:MAG: SPFH domain-containing protein [Patescibacteria group bacterium]